MSSLSSAPPQYGQPGITSGPQTTGKRSYSETVKATPSVLAAETFAQPKAPTPGSVPSWYAAVRPQPLASAPQSGEG